MGTTNIASSLAASAGRYARLALSEYAGNQSELFLLHAGLAIEHALKAKIARENAALLAPAKNYEAAIALGRASDDMARLPRLTKTIGAMDALAIAIVIDPSLKGPTNGVKALFEHRNGEAHMGHSGIECSRAEVADFLRAINALLRTDQDKFWDHNHQLVKDLLDERLEEAAAAVSLKVAAAKIRFQTRTGHLDPATLEGYLRMLELDRDKHLGDESMPLECPACGSPATLHGSNHLEFDVEVDRDGTQSAHYRVEFHADSLECGACSLFLSSEEELTLAGIDVVMDNDDVDPADHLGDPWD